MPLLRSLFGAGDGRRDAEAVDDTLALVAASIPTAKLMTSEQFQEYYAQHETTLYTGDDGDAIPASSHTIPAAGWCLVTQNVEDSPTVVVFEYEMAIVPDAPEPHGFGRAVVARLVSGGEVVLAIDKPSRGEGGMHGYTITIPSTGAAYSVDTQQQELCLEFIGRVGRSLKRWF